MRKAAIFLSFEKNSLRNIFNSFSSPFHMPGFSDLFFIPYSRYMSGNSCIVLQPTYVTRMSLNVTKGDHLEWFWRLRSIECWKQMFKNKQRIMWSKLFFECRQKKSSKSQTRANLWCFFLCELILEKSINFYERSRFWCPPLLPKKWWEMYRIYLSMVCVIFQSKNCCSDSEKSSTYWNDPETDQNYS